MSKTKIKKVLPNAVMPTKASKDDIGYDLTLIEKVKDIYPCPSGGVSISALYTTGLAIEPEEGYYFEVVPRSSLGKSGYMLANSVGIIDPCYRGQVMAILTKIDYQYDEIKLPWKCLQLIPRKIETLESTSFEEVEELSDTIRGEGGFGSTGK